MGKKYISNSLKVIFGIIIGIAVSVVITYFYIGNKKPAKNDVQVDVLVNEQTLPSTAENKEETDKNNSDISQTEDKKDSSNKESSLSLTYTDKFRIAIGEHIASIMIKNPKDSNYGISVSVQVEEPILNNIGINLSSLQKDSSTNRYVLSTSDIINPGEWINTLSIKESIDVSSIKEGTYDAYYWIELFDLTTGQKAALNTQIPIDFIVFRD